jgi:hypothetical protein
MTDDIHFLHNQVRIHISGAETAGAFALLEVSGPPGDQPPLHVHHHDDEGFYVLAGELTLWVGRVVRRRLRRCQLQHRGRGSSGAGDRSPGPSPGALALVHTPSVEFVSLTPTKSTLAVGRSAYAPTDDLGRPADRSLPSLDEAVCAAKRRKTPRGRPQTPAHTSNRSRSS